MHTCTNISPNNHIRRIVKRANSLLVSIKTDFKYADMKMLRLVLTVYSRPKLKYTAIACLPYLRGHIDHLSGKGSEAGNKDCTTIKKTLLQGEASSHRITHTRREKEEGRQDYNLKVSE